LKSIATAAVCLLFSLTCIETSWAQSAESGAWQALKEEKDALRQAKMLDSFITNYPDSSDRPEADRMLAEDYTQTKDNTKLLQHAENFRRTQPNADKASRSLIYSRAMLAAAGMGNNEKFKEYGLAAIEAEPDNLTVLVLLAGTSPLFTPEETLEFARRALNIPRPADMAEGQYRSLEARMHGVLGNELLTGKKYGEAAEHFEQGLMANPKDHTVQYRYGLANVHLAGMAQEAAAANAEELKIVQKAGKATESLQPVTGKSTAMEASMKYRDIALDAMAKSVAIGGQFMIEAQQVLDKLYTLKTGSLDGELEFIARKKADLGL